MNDEQQPCTSEDLRAVIPAYDRYDVDEDGVPVELESLGASDNDYVSVEEYECRNCGEFFTPEKRYDLEALGVAWQAALDHLPKQEAA